MIVKYYETDKINQSINNIFLFYGKNDGLKNEVIQKKFLNNIKGQVLKYEENDFIRNFSEILNELLNKSLFDEKKLIIVSRVSDKIYKIVDEMLQINLSDICIIFKSGILEKKSKLRGLFEKNKRLVAIPFYEDDTRNLTSIVTNFLNKNNIKLSRESINLIISRSSGDRNNLNNELEKIFNYSINNKKIEYETVKILTNLSENFAVNELADNYLSKNSKNVGKILNENNYSNDDCILILRTLLNKSKRLISLIEKYEEIKNLDDVIANTKPPIFWKEKENVKLQAKSWKIEELKKKIYEIGNIEILAKSDANNSLNIVSDFVINV